LLSLDYYTWEAFFAIFSKFSGATNVDISTSKIWNRFWANENIFKKLFFWDKKRALLIEYSFKCYLCCFLLLRVIAVPNPTQLLQHVFHLFYHLKLSLVFFNVGLPWYSVSTSLIVGCSASTTSVLLTCVISPVFGFTTYSVVSFSTLGFPLVSVIAVPKKTYLF